MRRLSPWLLSCFLRSRFLFGTSAHATIRQLGRDRAVSGNPSSQASCLPVTFDDSPHHLASSVVSELNHSYQRDTDCENRAAKLRKWYAQGLNLARKASKHQGREIRTNSGLARLSIRQHAS